MRVVVVIYAVAAAVVLCGAAVAQNNPDQLLPRSGGGAQTTGQTDPASGQANSGRQAPVGHRQPRAKDVPPGVEQNLGARSREDQAIDRKLRICRDC
jgi:hypothetical protein